MILQDSTPQSNNNLQTTNYIPDEHRAYGNAAHVTSARVCACGQHAVEFVQPGLLPGFRDTVQVHCVNPDCVYYYRTMEASAWAKLVAGEAA